MEVVKIFGYSFQGGGGWQKRHLSSCPSDRCPRKTFAGKFFCVQTFSLPFPSLPVYSLFIKSRKFVHFSPLLLLPQRAPPDWIKVIQKFVPLELSGFTNLPHIIFCLFNRTITAPPTMGGKVVKSRCFLSVSDTGWPIIGETFPLFMAFMAEG